MIKGAILDMDGLMFDTEKVYQDCWLRTAEFFDQYPYPELPGRMCGVNGELGKQVVHEFYPDLDPGDFLEVCFARAHYIFRTRPLIEKPGIHEILNYFREQGIKIGLTSGSTRDVVDSNLKKTGMDVYFDTIVTGDDVEKGKPDPEIFHTAADRMGCRPEECYVIEDSPNALKGAFAAGCLPVMIPDVTPADEETKKICVGIYPTLLEALEAIKSGEI